MKAYFVRILGVKHKSKSSRGFSKKYILNQQPPPCFFCGIVHYNSGSISIGGASLMGGGGGVKSLFSHIPNVFAVNILSKTGKIPSLIACCKLFLS